LFCAGGKPHQQQSREYSLWLLFFFSSKKKKTTTKKNQREYFIKFRKMVHGRVVKAEDGCLKENVAFSLSLYTFFLHGKEV
jgi:hypothetical protein